MAASKLSLYNTALLILGERRLETLYENREPRRVLDEFYSAGAIDYCLELAKPRFALKSAALSTPVVSSVHGLDYVYTLPTDYLTTIESGSFFYDNLFQNAVTRYLIEARTVATEVPTNLYVRYICNSRAMSDWTSSFERVVSAYLAFVCAPRINPTKQAVAEARFKDALETAVLVDGTRLVPPIPLARTAGSLTATKLEIFNDALRVIGLPQLQSANDDSMRRVLLDYAYDVKPMLEAIKPRFAAIVDTISTSTTDAEHGYGNVFTLPANYVTLLGIFKDNKMDEPIARYFFKALTVATETTAITLRYICNDVAEAAWTPSFKKALAGYLANEVASVLIETPAEAPATDGTTRTATAAQARIAELTRITKEFQLRVATAAQIDGYVEPAERAVPKIGTLTEAYRLLYNHALGLLKLPQILTTTDESQRRARLDQALQTRAVDTVLDVIGWNFACVTAKLTYDNTYTASWGYTYRHAVPAAMSRIDQIAADEFFRVPIDYRHEGGYFYSEHQYLYVSYVSTTFLTTPSTWPIYFWNMVAAELAKRVYDLPGADVENARVHYEQYLSEAFSTDAQRNPPQRIAGGAWTGARGRGLDRNRYHGR